MLKIKGEKRTGSEKDFSEILGIIYGHKTESLPVKVNYSEFEKIYKEVGTSAVFVLDIDGEEFEVIIKDIQVDPRKDRIHHIDFYAITRGEEMEAIVALNFVGEAPAEKLGMVLNTAKTEVEVKALPKDLPKEIDVDLSQLVDGDSVIRLKDLKLPEGVKFVGDEEETIVSVVAAKEVGEEGNNKGPDLSEAETENIEEKAE